MAEPKIVSVPKPRASLRTTAIGRQAEQPQKQSHFTPGAVALASETQRKKAAYAVAFGALALSAILIVAMAHIMSRQERIMVLDRSSTVHIGPLEKVTGESEIFRDLAIWSTQVALQRSPVGINLVEYVPLYFRPNAITALNSDVKVQLPDIQARNIRQFPDIKSYQFLRETQEDGQKVRFLRVDGNIIRAGYYQGLAIAESVPFRMVLAVMPNPNLTDRDKYPFMVEEFRIDLNPSRAQQ